MTEWPTLLLRFAAVVGVAFVVAVAASFILQTVGASPVRFYVVPAALTAGCAMDTIAPQAGLPRPSRPARRPSM